jgi:glycerophosphoryl diester phosphodiesterase
MKPPLCWLCLLFFPAWAFAQSAVFQPVTGFDVQGHRGCRGLYPENSLPAFRHALALGVTTLELDLAVSQDSQLVVSHEPWVSEVICRDSAGQPARGKADALWQRPYARIRSCDCGSAGNPRFPEQRNMATYKPLLTEVFDSVAVWTKRANRSPVAWNIELKSQPEWDGAFTPDVETFARLVVQMVDKYSLSEQMMIQSFDPRALEAVHRLNPRLCLVLLSERPGSLKKQLSRLSFPPACFSPWLLPSVRLMAKKA